MSITALILIFFSCVLHAGWNLACKSRTPSAAFFAIATASSVVVMSPFLFYFLPKSGAVPGAVWLLLLLSGFFQALYYVGLANAYRLNDMSLVYPATRALPVLMVPIVTTLIGSGKPLHPQAVLGMAVIVVGCLILPMASFRPTVLKRFFHYSFLFVVIAAIGTSGYSISDDTGLSLLTAANQTAQETTFSPVQAALFFITFEELSTLGFIWLFVLFSRPERINLRIIKRRSLTIPILAGPVVTTAYALVLLAMQFANNVSYIVAFRQMGIVFGVALGILVLKEKPTPYKLAGTAIILAGLILSALA